MRFRLNLPARTRGSLRYFSLLFVLLTAWLTAECATLRSALARQKLRLLASLLRQCQLAGGLIPPFGSIQIWRQDHEDLVHHRRLARLWRACRVSLDVTDEAQVKSTVVRGNLLSPRRHKSRVPFFDSISHLQSNSMGNRAPILHAMGRRYTTSGQLAVSDGMIRCGY